MTAGGDNDSSYAVLSGNSAAYVSVQTLALNVAHTFSGAGTATLSCDGDGVNTDAEWIKISAIRVGCLTNAPSS